MIFVIIWLIGFIVTLIPSLVSQRNDSKFPLTMNLAYFLSAVCFFLWPVVLPLLIYGIVTDDIGL